MVAFLGPLLGGLAGILFPGLAAGAGAAAAGGAAATGIGALLSKAMLPALGAGLGTLVTGGNGKDAIRNALLMGGATALFPGAVSGIQQSGFGKGITGGLANLLGIGGGGPEASTSTAPAAVPPPAPRVPAGTTEEPRPGFFGPSGMEMEARGSRPPSYSLPSISEMSDASRTRMSDRATRGFEQFGLPPLDASLSAAMGELGYPSVSEMSDAARTRMSDRATSGFEQFATPGIFSSPGMQMADTTQDLAMDRLLGAEPETPEKRRAAIDFLMSMRSRAIPSSALLPSYAQGGEIEGPGNGTSDSVPAMIYQGGKPVSKAALSDGEFVMTAKAVKGAGNGSRDRGISRMYELMRRFERGEMA